MTQTILITGATDGIGLRTAKMLAEDGHHVLLHGRNPDKLARAAAEVGGTTRQYVADLSDMTQVSALADAVLADHTRLDVLINNAGILKTPTPVLPDGTDIRFAVNTFAPYILTRRLLSIMPNTGRVVNLSSAAQAPVDLAALQGKKRLHDDMAAYAQSKLAITLWTKVWAQALPNGPQMIAVNPGSLLASKMVKEGFGVAGSDLGIGAKILCDAALGARFADVSGQYFDNDSGRFAAPHPAIEDAAASAAVMEAIDAYAAAHG